MAISGLGQIQRPAGDQVGGLSSPESQPRADFMGSAETVAVSIRPHLQHSKVR
jgi:hypothetical protein